MEINQFHSGTAVGDAITNQMILIQELLIKNGYESNIYAEHIAEELKDKILPISKYNGSDSNILFVHHSMGIDAFDKIIGLPDKKALIYHNITPEKFFDDNYIKQYIRIGLKQAKEYKDFLDYFIADSNYNRNELIHMGYESNIDVMPIDISLDRFDSIVENEQIINRLNDKKNILFVGRIVWNKRQTDLVKAFAVYHNYYNKESRLILVGDNSIESYINEIKSIAKRYNLEGSIEITGKVSEQDLKAYYMVADLFLCMSEHEGFGVPLLEAMKMNIPVLAYRSSAIPETMDGAGIIFNKKNYAYIGTLIDEILENEEINNKIIICQNKRIEKLVNTDTEKILLNAIHNIINKERKKSIQMQGPFESSYSLAIVNRKLIEAIDRLDKYDASIYCTEGPGDYTPKMEDLIDKHNAKRLWEKSKNINYPDITIRNMYPPRAYDVNGGLNFYSFGWEESIIPETYIKSFNENISGIGTMSDYVTEKLIECGITIPVKTMGIGVELCDNYHEISPYKLKSNKKVKFLHISSAFPRKGIELLLEGFYKAFTRDDDVCLVLKTFPNPHNEVEKILKQLNETYNNPPEVEWINCDLPQEKLFGLYKATDCYVQMSRGEGFGLPVAEAMLAKKPVIVCANSGMADFCNENTALLVDYTLVPAKTHVTTSTNGKTSMWAEPSVDSFVKQLKYFVNEISKEKLEIIVNNAYDLIVQEYSWSSVAKRWDDFIKKVEKNQFKPKVAMVTTWNTKCGIAEYTKMEVYSSGKKINYEIYPNYGDKIIKCDEKFVQPRLWKNAFSGNMDLLVEDLVKSANEIVHFQFNFGFFNLQQFGDAIKRISEIKRVVVTFHKTADSDVGGKIVSLKSIKNELNLCSALVVHQESDAMRLIEFGINSDIIFVIPHGQVLYPEMPAELLKKDNKINSSFVIGSYGFLLPHKGIKETISAISIVKKVIPDVLYMPVCALHDSDESKHYYRECVEEVNKLGLTENVRFITEYLDNDKSMKYLQSCDIMSMAYKPTKESASGAVRFCLASLRPIITTEQPIFDEFKECTYQINVCSSEMIAKAIMHMYNVCDKKEYVKKEKEYIKLTSWNETSNKFYELYCNILNK